jgi:hypothetical protein
MRETQQIEWTRTRLQPREREELLTALTTEQKTYLLDHDYVWVEGVGVLWKPADGALRRARFTHGTHFQTQRGEFYIDSEGSVREFSDRCIDPPASAARPPGLLLGDPMRYDDAGAATVSATRSPSRRRAAAGEHGTRGLLE